jgi:uncharacterized protein
MLTILALIAALSLPPKPDHYVTDHAGVLKNANALNEKLAQFERDTSDQIVVYVDRRLPADTTMEELASEAMRQWGVGQRGKDNGAILFVFVEDRKMRIEVGYGLEASLTDAKSRRIIETVIKPEFKRGDYETGINNGVDAMLAAVRGEAYRGSGRKLAEHRTTNPWIELVIFLLLFGVASIVIWMIVRLIARLPTGMPLLGGRSFSSSGSSSWSSNSWSSSNSSSSSSSSFSGGGGSGGGGGASGSW